jgi:hypothetical protein
VQGLTTRQKPRSVEVSKHATLIRRGHMAFISGHHITLGPYYSGSYTNSTCRNSRTPKCRRHLAPSSVELMCQRHMASISADMWHSFQVIWLHVIHPFPVTRVTLLSMTRQHNDVRPPRQIREIVLREVFLFSIQSSRMPKLVPSLNMVKRILELADG